MELGEATDFIRTAVGRGPGTWADLGAGRGTFSRALARLLGPEGLVLAVDRDRRALEALRRLPGRAGAGGRIEPVEGDLAELEAVAALDGIALDGALFGNSLHYLRRPERPLRWVAERLPPGGRLVVIEYEREKGNRWVPYPLPLRRLRAVVEEAGLPPPQVTARRPSLYHREMYCAVMTVRELSPTSVSSGHAR